MNLEIIGHDGEWYCPIGAVCAWAALFQDRIESAYGDTEWATILNLMLAGI